LAVEACKAPVSEVDPFCREFFEDPFPAHEELRESGSVVRLSRYGVWAVARYDEVHGGRCDAMPSRRMGSALRSTKRLTPGS
jgi:hypothetical protein